MFTSPTNMLTLINYTHSPGKNGGKLQAHQTNAYIYIPNIKERMVFGLIFSSVGQAARVLNILVRRGI